MTSVAQKQPDSPAPRTQQLGLTDRLGLISLIDEGMRLGLEEAPGAADLFENLWSLVNQTVRGAKVDRLNPEGGANGYKVIEVTSETGETLGRLNMIYLNKPIPCYYLVYVEVAPPFRNKGLGSRILESFRDFLDRKSALGVLDNIIPDEDPTYGIYYKQAWVPLEEVIGETALEAGGVYMLYIPPRLAQRDIRQPVVRLIHHLERRRAAIEMRDNEVMVGQTITEFKELYQALLTYFAPELEEGRSTPLMRFMFTRFVTKLISFRRRIGELIGYTGGQSMDQLALDPAILALEMKSYAPRELAGRPAMAFGDMEVVSELPQELLKDPVAAIEGLPNYYRPKLAAWLEERGMTLTDRLTIGHLMDLGFDPTRLKEITLGGQAYIFERLQARLLPELERKRDLLEPTGYWPEMRIQQAQVIANPPLVAIRNRGAAYVLRKKVDGIHWEEAVEQLQTSPRLKSLNEALGLEGVIKSTVRRALDRTAEKLRVDGQTLRDQVTAFVSWNLEINQPRLTADFSGSWLETVWLA